MIYITKCIQIFKRIKTTRIIRKDSLQYQEREIELLLKTQRKIMENGWIKQSK